jgi:hypothetical protein
MKQFISLTKLLALLSLGLVLAGCSAPTSASLAAEICESRFSLIDIDPNSDSGAPRWYQVWEKTLEIRSADSTNDQEIAVASAMEDWFNSVVQAVQDGRQWPLYGEGFAEAGLALNDACQLID